MGTRRVGHAGTLDPLATGLLVIAVGPATRFLQYLPLEPKEYVGEITFGVSTDSYDSEGEVIQRRPVPSDLEELIRLALPQFRGLIEQLPPMHSAVKVGGKPLYHYARQGKEMKRESRRVHIETFDVLEVQGEVARVRIICSGGTYVRTLAFDLGEAIGCGAHLSKLERTKVGRFEVDRAVDLDACSPKNLLPLTEALPPMPLLNISTAQIEHIREGRHILVPEQPSGPLCALLDLSGNVFSVARVSGNMLQPECVIPAEALDETV